MFFGGVRFRFLVHWGQSDGLQSELSGSFEADKGDVPGEPEQPVLTYFFQAFDRYCLVLMGGGGGNVQYVFGQQPRCYRQVLGLVGSSNLTPMAAISYCLWMMSDPRLGR